MAVERTPLRVAPHPYRPGWTHIITPADANRRGWHFLGFSAGIPFGLWRSRSAAAQAAREIERTGATFCFVEDRRGSS